MPGASESRDWTFLTNHAHVMICLAADPDTTMREVAQRVGITERAVQRIVSELEEAGYLQHRRVGRHNRYTVRRTLPLRHPVEAQRHVGDLLDLALGTPARRR